MEIKITDLGKRYGSFQAIQGLQLTIQKGMFGLIGPNGAGKTSLMQILSTLEPVTSGRIVFSGMPTSGERSGERTPGDARQKELVLGQDDQAIRSLLGYLPQEFGVYKKLTGYEYLDYVAMMKGIVHSRQRKQEIAELLEKVNLTQHAKKKVGSYSGGMKQRIGIAQALLGSPQVIIVDEPTAGLDPEERIRFRNLLGELSADRIIILSTHIVADIESSCSQLAIMKQGRILFQGTQDALLGEVRDRVWTGIVDEAQLILLRTHTQIISARKVQEGQEIRVISDERPFPSAERARPGLEDAYMSVMQAAEQKEALV